MSGRLLAPILAGVALALLAGEPAAAGCVLEKRATLAVTLIGSRPFVPARIDGRDVALLVDSGVAYSTLPPALADRLGLNVVEGPKSWRIRGVGGDTPLSYTRPVEVAIGGRPAEPRSFLVGGGDFGPVGLLGQDVLADGDVEYDLPGGAIHFFRVAGCDRTMPAYWAGDRPVSVVDLEALGGGRLLRGRASLEGLPVSVVFDTGAVMSVLSLRAARRLGFQPQNEGVTPGPTIEGMGPRRLSSWIAPFSKFEIGGETIANTRLPVADLAALSADMVIGADFFLSHRIYISPDRRRMYFTYAGGPVFRPAADTPAERAAAQ